jgi:predicted nucleic acid-binding protein
MEQQYLIDSNAVIDYLAGNLPEKGMEFLNFIVNQIPIVSVITKIEVLGFPCNKEIEKLLESFFADSNIIKLSDDIVDETINIRRQYKIKTPDAIIAATARINSFIIITRNTKDFDTIDGLSLVNPFNL